MVLAAGTTVVDSELLHAVIDRYERETGARVSVTGAATQQVLALGDRNAADVLVTHAPAQEAAFLESHPDAVGVDLFTSKYLLVGPESVVPVLDGLTPLGAFDRIAQDRLTFVTRNDGSGTFDKERELWATAGIVPDGDWYLVTGQGMGFSLQVADQRGALILVEQGVFLGVQDTIDLVPVQLLPFRNLLENPYTAIATASAGPGADLVAWLASPVGKEAIEEANRAIFASIVYQP